jgi:DNA repair exonuclease SbcCD ATPase subunit
VSDKMICPGCGSYTSAIHEAYERGQACPSCGLSHEAAKEIDAVRESRATAEFQAKYEQALKDRDQARADLKRASARLAYMESLISDAATRLAKPLSEEEVGRRW